MNEIRKKFGIDVEQYLINTLRQEIDKEIMKEVRRQNAETIEDKIMFYEDRYNSCANSTIFNGMADAALKSVILFRTKKILRDYCGIKGPSGY